MKRRILSALMALVMVLSLVPAGIWAADHEGQVRVIVENTTFPMADGAPWEGTLVDEWVTLDSDSTMMSCVVDALGEDHTQVGAESNYISEIDGLAAFDGGGMSGWMGTLNDWFTNEGFGGFTVENGKLEAGDEIRIMYTCNGYGEDLGGSWSNSDKTVKDISFSTGVLAPAYDKDTHAYTLTIGKDVTEVLVTPTASNRNYQVRASVAGTEYKRTAMIPVTAGTVITVTCGDPSWPSMNDNSGAAQVYTITVAKEKAKLTGKGTEAEPYLIYNEEDMRALDSWVEDGEAQAGVYFKMMNDIVITGEWDGIGSVSPAMPFSGDFDGNGCKLTLPVGSQAVFAKSRGAVIHDLRVYGEQIDDYGLVSAYSVDKKSTYYVQFKNVTLVSGTKTLKSGFIGGYASGQDQILIDSCTVEENVVIGYKRDQSNIGSFGGEFNGTITNSVSNATVYGVNFVGGLIGNKGQTMGDCKMLNCTFNGKVEATGKYVGGIIGGGYAGTGWGMSSAPNSPGVTIRECVNFGSITGANAVGGIMGAEACTQQFWANGIFYLEGNCSYGTVTGTADGAYVGGIVGFLQSLNRYAQIEGNTYANAARGIGAVGHVDTSGVSGGFHNGTYYYNTSVDALEEINTKPLETYVDLPTIGTATTGWSRALSKKEHNRTDDPLGKDMNKLVSAITVKKLEMSGSCKTEYELGEALELTGLELTAVWSDESKTKVALKDVTVSGYDKDTAGEQTVTLRYAGAEAKLKVKVIRELTLKEKYEITGGYMAGLGTPGVGSIGGEWMVIGLERSGIATPGAADYYAAVVQYVEEHADENERLHRAKSTDNSRIILALTALGKDVTNVGGHNLLKGLDNMAYIQKQGINGPIWALIALDSHDYPTGGDVSREKLLRVVLDKQLADGGWALSGSKADPDMTAMAVQALAEYYSDNAEVKAAVDAALACLSKLQLDNGGYGSWGTENSESSAQVIVALTALGIDPARDTRFNKNGLTPLDALGEYFVEGGGFKHIAAGERNGMATEQAYYALASYFRLLDGKTRLYDMSDVTIETQPDNGGKDDGTQQPAPETGDTGVAAPAAAALVSVLGIALLMVQKKRRYSK